jgi:hypothetical protein
VITTLAFEKKTPIFFFEYWQNKQMITRK